MLRKLYNKLFKKKREKPAAPFSPGAPLKLRYEIEQTDFFQFEFLQSYWESRYIRKTSKRNFFIWSVVGASLFAIIFFSSLPSAALWICLLPLLYMFISGYNYFFGYQNDYKQLQKLLARALDKDLNVFAKTDMVVEFGANDVSVTNETERENRMFFYNDIEFIEQTDRLFVIGLYDDASQPHLYDFRKLLITKRYLGNEQKKQLEALLGAATAHYKLPPILDDHPFK